MRSKWLAGFLGLTIAFGTASISRADDKVKQKTKVENDGDVKIEKKYKDPSGKHHKVKTKIDQEGDKVKVKSKDKVSH